MNVALEPTNDTIEEAKKEVSTEFLVKNFAEINERISDLYASKKALTQLAINEFGVDTPLITQNPDGTYTRVKVLDNQNRMEDGYYEFVRVERYSVKLDNLKTKPKELKDE